VKYIFWLLIAINSCFAQGFDHLSETFRPAVNDARSRAMGHTALLSASGGESMFYNPANMGKINRQMMHVDSRMLYGSTNDEYYKLNPEFNKKFKPHLKITGISFAFTHRPPIPKTKIVAGIGYNTYIDLGQTQTIEGWESVFLDRIHYKDKVMNHGGLNTLSPAIAVGIKNRYYLGLAINKAILSKVSEAIDHTILSEIDYEYINHSELEVDLSALFFTFGTAVKINQELDIGFSYRSKFMCRLDNLKTYSRYTNGNDYSFNYESYEVEIDIPAFYGLGISYQVSKQVLLIAEYQSRPFSAIEVDGEKYGIDSGNCYGAGLEIQSKVKYRLGYFSESILKSDEDETQPKTLNGITGGLGIEIGFVNLDFFGEYATWNYMQGIYGAGDFKYSERRFTTGITVTAYLDSID